MVVPPLVAKALLNREFEAPKSIAAECSTRLGDDRFPCCSQEDVAMIITSSQPLPKTLPTTSMPPMSSARHRQDQSPHREGDGEEPMPVPQAPQHWPRVF